MYAARLCNFKQMGITLKKFLPKSMINEVKCVEKDNSGNYFFLTANSNFDKNKTTYDMTDMSRKADALRECMPFATVINRCASMFCNGKYYVVDEKNNERKSYKDRRALLEKPNLLQNGKQFSKEIYTYLKTFGFCPVFTLRATASSFPKAIIPVNPLFFHLISTGNFFPQTDLSGIIQRAYIDWGGIEIDLEEEDYFIIYDSMRIPPNEGDEITFNSVTDSLSPQISNYMSQITARGNLIVNGGPKGIIHNDDTTELGNSSLTSEEKDKRNKEFKRKYGLVGKMYEIMISTKNLGWIPLSYDTKQLMLHEEDQACFKDIANALGIDPSVLMPNSTYDNKTGAKKDAYQEFIMPDGEMVAQALTQVLCAQSVYIRYLKESADKFGELRTDKFFLEYINILGI